jgi:hypothetical protein
MLEIFAVPGGSTLTNVLKSPWTTCCFFMLTNLVIYVDSLSREGFQKLWDEASKFQRLELWPSPRQPPTSHAGAAMVPRGSPNMEVDYFLPASTKASKQVGFNAIVGHQVTDALKLKKLFIGSVVLPKTLGSMSQRIDVLAFHELVLDAFAGASELFEALATSLNAGKSCLKYLRLLRLPEQGAGEVLLSLSVLLMSFHGLQRLHIQCTDDPTVIVEGIVNHGETLKTLLFVNGGIHRDDKEKCWDASDLLRIATSCTEIEQLCVNI